MKYSLAYMAAVLSCGVAAAQEAQPAQKECCDAFKFDLATDVSLFNFEDGNILAVTEKFSFKNDKTTIGVGLSFYNDQNDSFNPREFAWQLNDGVNDVSGTGLGDVDVFLKHNLFDGKCGFFSADSFVDVLAGVKIPVQGAYSSDEPVIYVGGEAGLSWGEISLNQTFTYSFVDAYTYSPLFGGFINDDLYGGVTSVSYEVNKDITVSVNGNQQYFGNNFAYLLGPSVSWDFSKNATLTAGVDFPLSYDAQSADLNTVINAGISFKF